MPSKSKFSITEKVDNDPSPWGMQHSYHDLMTKSHRILNTITTRNESWNHDLNRLNESPIFKNKKKKVKFYHQMVEIGGDDNEMKE